MSGTERHVRPHPKGGWEVRAPGASRTSGRFEDSAAATQRARDIVARQGGGRVLVHDANGSVVQTVTVEARAKAADTKSGGGDGPGDDTAGRTGPEHPTDAGDPEAMADDDAEHGDPTGATGVDRGRGEADGDSEQESDPADPELFVDATATTRLPSFAAEEQDEAGAEPVGGAESAAQDRPERTSGADGGAGRSDGSLAGLAAKTAADVKELVAAEARLIKAGLRHELRRLVVNGGAAGAVAVLERLGHGRRSGRNKLRSSR